MLVKFPCLKSSILEADPENKWSSSSFVVKYSTFHTVISLYSPVVCISDRNNYSQME